MSVKENKKKFSKGKMAVMMAGILLLTAGLWFATHKTGAAVDLPGDTASAVQEQPDQQKQVQWVLKEALQVQKIDSYSGIYWEDGSDEEVSDILAMTVTNITAEPIQYAEITMELGTGTAKFTVSALPSGATAVLLEQNRMAYSRNTDYTQANAECTHLAGFDKPLSLYEDKLQLQLLDGALNITNISGEDIPGTIVLCYKNASDGIYQGGIAYRIRLDGGLKAGEIRQSMASHIHQPGTEMIFAEITE